MPQMLGENWTGFTGLFLLLEYYVYVTTLLIFSIKSNTIKTAVFFF